MPGIPRILLNVFDVRDGADPRLVESLDGKGDLAPGLVLPLMTAHSCYHGRCPFCNVGYGGGIAFYALAIPAWFLLYASGHCEKKDNSG